MKYQLALHSLAGGRATNQDRVVCTERDNAVLMVLADGLGGHAGGALAAETLTQTALHAFEAVRQPVITKPSAFLALTIMQAHKAIYARGQAQEPPISPRTTCVLCLVQNGYAYWAHVGDSRLYHFRNGQLLSRTLDHTVTEQMHLDGLLSEEEMKRHPDKARLLKAVGGPRTPSISLGQEIALQRGDTLLLCTDGLWEALTADELFEYLSYPTLDEGVEEMLLAAEKRMKQRADNLSAICLRWQDNITNSLPLQTQTLPETDHKTLLEDAHIRNAEQKLRGRGSTDTQDNTRKTLENTIDELEAFLAHFEKKP
jgi:serine/threonine protein phosphatase PrpC